ncbi:hypothetical protein [Enterococcus devriesei]|uniref:hypothetical protein n=1 Tax=Enterococcus devriesei TaxID=319970 RepID=UPI0036D29764
MKKFMSHLTILLMICAQIGSSVTVFGEESGQSLKLEQSNGDSEEIDTVETTASTPMSDLEEKQNTKLEQPNVSPSGFESIPRTRFVRIFSRFQRVSISSFRPAVKPKPFDR